MRSKLVTITIVTAVIASMTSTVAHAATNPIFPLSTKGNQIVDASGNRVIWQGVNWYGMENEPATLIGLNARDYKLMLKQIRQTGFNTIRVPFSMQTLAKGPEVSGVADYIGSNKELKGKSPMEVLDAVIVEAEKLGLMIILDNHSQADQGYRNDLWYGQAGFTEDMWVSMWRDLAIRYKDSPNVVGFDLKNEPHGKATWGDGAETDWRRAAERAGRDPSKVRVWSCFATIGDHIAPDLRLKKTVGRLATYLQGYGDLMVSTNNWDPQVLQRFRNDDFVKSFRGALDGAASTEQLEHIASLIPDEWLDSAAMGTPAQCVQSIRQQFDLGVDGVILHGATPDELEPIILEYRRTRQAEFFKHLSANPGG